MTGYFLTAVLLGGGGGLHCLGMCGPLATAVAGFTPKAQFWWLQGVYHAGRILAYMFMGAAAAAVGGILFADDALRWLSIAAGVLMLSTLFFKFGASSGWLSRAVAHAARRTGPGAFLLMGVANGFLPCGLSFTAAAGAAAAGSAVDGGLYMLIFGVCTIPVLAVAVALRRRLALRPWMTRAVVAVAACFLILRGMNLGIPGVSPEMRAGKVNCCEKKAH